MEKDAFFSGRTKGVSERDEFLANIRSITAMVRSLTGPQSMRKQIIVDSCSRNDPCITSSPTEFLRNIDVEGPGMCMVTDAMEGQERGAGCGVGWTLVLGGLFLGAAQRLERSGIPQGAIEAGFAMGMDACEEVSEALGVDLHEISRHVDEQCRKNLVDRAKRLLFDPELHLDDRPVLTPSTTGNGHSDIQAILPEETEPIATSEIGLLAVVEGVEKTLVIEDSRTGPNKQSNPDLVGFEDESDFDWFFEGDCGADSSNYSTSQKENSSFQDHRQGRESPNRSGRSHLTVEQTTLPERNHFVTDKADRCGDGRVLGGLLAAMTTKDDFARSLVLAAAMQFPTTKHISSRRILVNEILGPPNSDSFITNGLCLPLKSEGDLVSDAIDICGVRSGTAMIGCAVEEGVAGDISTVIDAMNRCSLVLEELEDCEAVPMPTQGDPDRGWEGLVSTICRRMRPKSRQLALFIGGGVPKEVEQAFKNAGVCVFSDLGRKTIRHLTDYLGVLPAPNLGYVANDLCAEVTITIVEAGWELEESVRKIGRNNHPTNYIAVVQQPAQLQERKGDRTIASIVVCSPTHYQLQHLKESVLQSLAKLENALSAGCCLPGGGAWELVCAALLTRKADRFLKTCSTDSQSEAELYVPSVLKEFAECFTDLVSIVIQNMGNSFGEASEKVSESMVALEDRILPHVALVEQPWVKDYVLSMFPIVQDGDSRFIVDDLVSRTQGVKLAGFMALQSMRVGYLITNQT